MRTFIFMNHHLRDKKSREPVITVQTGDRRVHVNKVRVTGEVEVCTGSLSEVKTHEVRAWIEVLGGKVEILE